MNLRPLAIALCVAACGHVAGEPSDGAVADQPPTGTATTYKARTDYTDTVMFGGSGFCMYTITLQQLEVELAVEPSGQVSSGTVRDVNLETVVATVPPCAAGPIPPNLATYTLESAKPAVGGTMLTFQGAATNRPTVVLTGTLASAGSAYTISLGFHRVGTTSPVLDWSVVATLTLAAQ